MQTDYLNRGTCAVLTQFQDGNEHPICYYGRKLLPHDQKYSTIEKELLLLNWVNWVQSLPVGLTFYCPNRSLGSTVVGAF